MLISLSEAVDTYHDIQMKGVEFLRNVYASSGLSIKPKTKVSKIEALKEMVRAWEMNSDQMLIREALSQGATVYISPEDLENHQLTALINAVKQMIRQEAVQMRSVGGGPAGT